MLTRDQAQRTRIAARLAKATAANKTREHEAVLRAAAGDLLDVADELAAKRDAPRVYVVPVDPAEATICEACE